MWPYLPFEVHRVVPIAGVDVLTDTTHPGPSDLVSGMARLVYWPTTILLTSGPFYPLAPPFSYS